MKKQQLVKDSGFYFGDNTNSSVHFYNRESVALANFIFSSNLNGIKDLFIWIYNNKPKTQVITIERWYGSKWYITVRFSTEENLKRDFDSVESTQLGLLTVD